MNSLDDIRGEINKIDIDLVRLLVRRTDLALQTRRFKKAHPIGISAADRVQQVLGAVRLRAAEIGGNPDSIQRIYEAIIHELTELQLKELKTSGPVSNTC